MLMLLQLILRLLGRYDWKDKAFWKMYMAPKRDRGVRL